MCYMKLQNRMRVAITVKCFFYLLIILLTSVDMTLRQASHGWMTTAFHHTPQSEPQSYLSVPVLDLHGIMLHKVSVELECVL